MFFSVALQGLGIVVGDDMAGYSAQAALGPTLAAARAGVPVGL